MSLNASLTSHYGPSRPPDPASAHMLNQPRSTESPAEANSTKTQGWCTQALDLPLSGVWSIPWSAGRLA
eukprot:4458528-Alexandrium_andersonii.AAC.1